MTETEGRATAERRRRMIVDLLDADAPHAHNFHILRIALEGFGENAGVDEIEGHAEWLAEAGLVELAHRDSPIPVACITDRGRDLAADRISVSGVAARLLS